MLTPYCASSPSSEPEPSMNVLREGGTRQLARRAHCLREADRQDLARPGKRCKQAIHQYRSATRRAAEANLAYLDSHPRAGLTQIGRELNGQPYATLKSRTFSAKSNAVRVCG
jgi:hypothetical protein